MFSSSMVFFVNRFFSEWSVLLGILGCQNSIWRVLHRFAKVANQKSQKSVEFACFLSDSILRDSSPLKENYRFFGKNMLCDVFSKLSNNPI